MKKLKFRRLAFKIVLSHSWSWHFARHLAASETDVAKADSK